MDFKVILLVFLFVGCGVVSKPSYFPSTDLEYKSKNGVLTLHHYEKGNQLSNNQIESVKSDVLYKIIYEGFRGKYTTNPILNKTVISKPYNEIKDQFIDRLSLIKKNTVKKYPLYI